MTVTPPRDSLSEISVSTFNNVDVDPSVRLILDDSHHYLARPETTVCL
jgi:hypothetical protein